MTVNLTAQSTPTTSLLDEALVRPPKRQRPVIIGAVVGLIILGGWWLRHNFGSISNLAPQWAALAGDFNKGSEGISDELVQFIAQSLENNLITSSANPLLTATERRDLVISALADLEDPDVRQQIHRDHQALAAEMKKQGLGKEAWYEHLAACQKVCQTAFSALAERHFAKVGQSVHGVVFFEKGSGELDSASRRDVHHFADLLSNRMYTDRHILLIGRASRSGAHRHNMALSERRVRAVKNELVRHGVGSPRIRTFWLGWEQPDLTRTIAHLYRIPEYLFDNDEIRLNQSVVMVLYEGDK